MRKITGAVVMPEWVIRPMSRSELDFAVDLAAAEGWNPGLYDADAFYAADPHGFLIGLLDGQPIGCISAVSYAGQFGFIGFYIVVPAQRGRGYDIQLWHAGMARLAGQTIGLDGVVAQQDNYKKSGFVWAYSNIRYEGRTGLGSVAPAVRPLAELPFDAVLAYDRACFPAQRTAFLQHWLRLPAAAALGYVEQGRLRGYGVIRPCRQGYKIGPLFADNAHIAEALLVALAAAVLADAPLYLDVPEVNAPALALAQHFGMQAVFGTARMYVGPSPRLALERVFGVTTFELG